MVTEKREREKERDRQRQRQHFHCEREAREYVIAYLYEAIQRKSMTE